MTTSSYEAGTTDDDRGATPGPASTEVNPWARGFAAFAAVMMVMIGLLHVVMGLVAIFQNQFYVVTTGYLFQFDVTSWGWIHLGLGILIGLAGGMVLSGVVWARAVGITLAALSLIANFVFLPYYPIWAILIIAQDVLVIWALCVYNSRSAAIDRFGR